MSQVEVLVATMHQTDFSLVEKMNLHSDAVIGNQADCNELVFLEHEGNKIRMQSTETRGASVNRNITLALAKGEILLIADDDVIYLDDDYSKQIGAAFAELPDADVIIFRMQFSKSGKVYETSQFNIRRLHLWNHLGFGSCQIAIRRSSLLRANLNFAQCMGPGSGYYSAGEDSLFLLDCLRKKLRMYTHTYLLGTTKKDESTWFRGYTEQYFYDMGAFLELAHPMLKYIYLLRFAFGLRKDCKLSVWQKAHALNCGMRGFTTLRGYTDWEKEKAL